MRRAEIYLKAAKLVHTAKSMGGEPAKWFSCNAIGLASRYSIQGTCARAAFGDRFANSMTGGKPWLSTMHAEDEWGKKGRVLALCFAAAMAETRDI